ncbi:VIT family protein [Rhodoferax sp. PAMC 29310]|uniref:VIT1/CCC1 transporter family protein n=1 Tax=Rhodoferax sp. PAMC 29310 TaxID=2822760 RepID=UPI001B323900|nr:VIT family protein [Rhodoferax sp. PAMC 29310]
MRSSRNHKEHHRTDRVGWLRAAVLGANDGIVSTASLLMGVAAASVSHSGLLMIGVAGQVAGAMSMAAGEYVSVHSQEDTENSDLVRERAEFLANPAAEAKELTAIYVTRGLDLGLAQQVAEQLMKHDALGAHARDELGITQALSAQPVQAALVSAASFAIGAALPLGAAALMPASILFVGLAVLSLTFLALLGAIVAWTGGTPVAISMWRVTLWGAMAMAITAGVGSLFGTAT